MKCYYFCFESCLKRLRALKILLKGFLLAALLSDVSESAVLVFCTEKRGQPVRFHKVTSICCKTSLQISQLHVPVLKWGLCSPAEQSSKE